MKEKVIGSGKPKRVSKSSWECRIRKWAEDSQEERNGTKEPTSNVMDQESPKWHEYKSNDHIESLREEQVTGPKRPSKHGSNNTMAGIVE